MAEQQFSAGGVVIRKNEEKIEVLLIKDRFGHWTWPKGHIEDGETPGQAAIREITEETGLRTLCVLQELGRQKYTFQYAGKTIHKTVDIFLVKAVKNEKLVIQGSEIDSGRWLSAEKALELIEYEGSRNILGRGIAVFNEKYKV